MGKIKDGAAGQVAETKVKLSRGQERNGSQLFLLNSE